jgi:putative ABC transport system substrate-binding protein
MDMKRRTFIALVGGVAAAVARIADGHTQGRLIRIGYLANLSPAATPDLFAALRDGLREHGYIEGQNLAIESRWAADMRESLAAELVALKVDVIVAWATPAVTAARRATTRIPIVMVGIADPIGAGFIASLSRPGGNVTGTTNLARDLGGKLLELLREVVPTINPIFVLRNPRNPASPLQLREVEVAVRAMGLQLALVEVTTPKELDEAFARMTREKARGVITLADPLLISQRGRIAELAGKARLPVVFSRRENVDAGGLISYGPSLRGQFRETATYVDKILKGASPANLPVEQPTRLELIVNLKTAKELGIAVPPTILLRADEVIE